MSEFPTSNETSVIMSILLWLIAVVVAIVGVIQLIQGQIILGIVLLVVACLIGPGGYSIFQRNG